MLQAAVTLTAFHRNSHPEFGPLPGFEAVGLGCFTRALELNWMR